MIEQGRKRSNDFSQGMFLQKKQNEHEDKKERGGGLTRVNRREDFLDPLGERIRGKSNKVMVNKIHKDKWNYI